MSMAQAARNLGISVSLVRHYEKEFGLQFGRTKGGQRVISDRDLENLRIIRSYRERNLPIDEIRRQLSPESSEVSEALPDIKEVLKALVSRQDDLERVVKGQQDAISELLGENQRLRLAHDQVQLLLAAPKEPDPAILQLVDQVAALEDQQQRELEALRQRFESLQNAVDSTPEGASEEAESLLARLAELEREMQAREEPAEASAEREALREKLQALEQALAAKAKGPSEELVKGLQRRVLDLEAAMATREESPTGSDDESLLETLVSAIQSQAKTKPWWRFWG